MSATNIARFIAFAPERLSTHLAPVILFGIDSSGKPIARLEQAIGVSLLNRSRHGVEATLYGRALMKRGIVVFDELRRGVRDIECLADPTVGELQIGCPEVMAAGPVVAAGVTSPWTRRRRVKLADLINESWALTPFDGFFGATLAEAFRASGLTLPHTTIVTLSVDMREKLLATGRYPTECNGTAGRQRSNRFWIRRLA